MTDKTWFDLGSLTKVVATTSIVARLVQAGKLSLDSSVDSFFPQLKASPLGAIQLYHLLNHSSGLAAWAPIYQQIGDSDLIDWFASGGHQLMVYSPGTDHIYSDLGILLLGLCLESQFSLLETLFQEQVVGPLNLKRIQYGPIESSVDCSMTEYRFSRHDYVHGEVFDENCQKLGPICPHAGLFGTATTLAPWASEWLKAGLGKSNWIKQETAKQFTTPQKGTTWALGWDTKSPMGSTCGEYFSSGSYGHLGFPGCSVWIDPKYERFAIFLTNRVHPSRYDRRIKYIRPEVHDAWVRFCEGKA